MEKIFSRIAKLNVYPLILALVIGLIVGANYSPNTFLSGWDTLHPEFNFQLAFSRAAVGVWRADQGLGAVAIQSHLADLPRLVFLWLSSLFLPLNFLRYLTFFVALLVGPLGVFYLVKYLLSDHERLVPFLAALAYLTSLATVQHFNVPLEMFAVHYALLPWLFLTTIKFFQGGSRRVFLLFGLLTLLAVPQAQTATLFYAYFLGLALYLTCAWLLKTASFKRGATLVAATLAINAFWILPNLYAVARHAEAVRQSKVNRLFSQEAFAKNQEFGNLKDTLVFKNFLFDWELYNIKTQRFEPVLKPWIDHLQNPATAGAGYLVAAVALLGILRVVKERKRPALAFLPVLLLSLLFIQNGTWPMTEVFKALEGRFPLVYEALRFPFTKFSILLLLTTSIYVAYGLSGIMSYLHKPKFKFAFVLFWTSVSLWYFAPAFTGNLINPAMRIQIPQEYFQMFTWFKGQNHEGRVAILPIHSFWNWTYYEWGYQGAGFLQFGIPQPILDRDYDRWSPTNEQYQREMAYAIYSQNPKVIAMVLAKFNIRWILFDKSVVAPGQLAGSTLEWLIPSLLRKVLGVSSVTQFGQNLFIYQVKVTEPNRVASLRSDLPIVKTEIEGAPFDLAYATKGDYLSPVERSGAGQLFDRFEHYLGPVGETVDQVSTSSLDPLLPCGQPQADIVSKRQVSTEVIRYTSSNGQLCDHVAFPNLNHGEAYVLEIESRNLAGFPLELCVSNDLTRHCDLFVRLGEQKSFTRESFLLPPLSDYGSGYTVNLNNFAVKGGTSVNEIKNLMISKAAYQMPLAFQGLALNSARPSEQPSVYRYNLALYKVSFNKAITQGFKDTVLVFNQAFEPGWIAWDGKQVLKHVLVNDWANGWVINPVKQLITDNQQLTIILFFLPQLLEWLGLTLLPLPFVLAFFRPISDT